jgi:hypothetical protein
VKIAHEWTTIERRMEETDREIVQLVYQLYGLTEEEITLVEGGDGVSGRRALPRLPRRQNGKQFTTACGLYSSPTRRPPLLPPRQPGQKRFVIRFRGLTPPGSTMPPLRG